MNEFNQEKLQYEQGFLTKYLELSFTFLNDFLFNQEIFGWIKLKCFWSHSTILICNLTMFLNFQYTINQLQFSRY